MNVFVLNTGRCGSTTFVKACGHITNYTCAHESRSAALGDDRLDYPENHIEADNRLAWLLGRLDRVYGDSAFYVHLKRNKRDTAQSYANRYSIGIMKAYRGQGILNGLSEESDPLSVALDYCDTVNSNIELFLKDKTQKMVVNLEDMDQDFSLFWDRIGAKGDRNAALEEISTRYNASRQNQPRNVGGTLVQILSKLKRLVVKLPDYVKNA